MSAFEARIRVGEAGVQLVRDNDDEKALEAELVLGIITLAPVGPGQVMPIPFGAIRVPFDKAAIDGLAKQFTEASAEMKEKSNIEVAQSLEGVERAAAFSENLKS